LEWEWVLCRPLVGGVSPWVKGLKASHRALGEPCAPYLPWPMWMMGSVLGVVDPLRQAVEATVGVVDLSPNRDTWRRRAGALHGLGPPQATVHSTGSPHLLLLLLLVLPVHGLVLHWLHLRCPRTLLPAHGRALVVFPSCQTLLGAMVVGMVVVVVVVVVAGVRLVACPLARNVPSPPLRAYTRRPCHLPLAPWGEVGCSVPNAMSTSDDCKCLLHGRLPPADGLGPTAHDHLVRAYPGVAAGVVVVVAAGVRVAGRDTEPRLLSQGSRAQWTFRWV
jgi:hypothetical protein